MRPIFPSRRWRGDFTSQFGLFLFFVFFPATFTAVAPRATVELKREAAGVSVTTCSHTLFFIPYWCQTERRVARIELELHEGERVGYNAHLSEAMNRVNRRGKTEDSAVIHFLGDGEGASVMIEIGRMNDVLAQAQAFLHDSDREALTLSFFAHRVMGLYVALPISLLVLIYIPLLGLTLVRLALGRPYWPFDAGSA